MARKVKQQASGRPVNNDDMSSSNTAAVASSTAVAERPPRVSLWRNKSAQRALYLIVLAAMYSPLSQLILAPVYGSIPSAIWHKYAMTCAALVPFMIKGSLPNWTDKALPSFAFWIPSIQFALFQYSSVLGNPVGPLVTEICTTFPLIILTLYAATKLVVEDVDLSYLENDILVEVGPLMTIYLSFTVMQRLFRTSLPHWIGGNFFLTRVGLQLSIATLYGLILPQSLFWPALPSIAFTMIANPHTSLQRTTAVLNNTLALYDYTVLERRESLTGYISVLQDNTKGFRVMRCDHSLLGGEWQIPPPVDPRRRVGEPIYAVFTMLEAVRLIEPLPSHPRIADQDATALTIGLGIGTAPTALIAHGINTTVVELDPVIHYFAGKYFNLPKNHSYYIGDATNFVYGRANTIASSSSSSTAKPNLQYDYIIHDTFTGGALPIPLFTRSFLQSFSSLLKPTTGVIAINYAGDLNMPSAALVHRTIVSVFRSCRIFREDDPTEAAAAHQAESEDFTNLVYFCRAAAPTTTNNDKEEKANNIINFRTPSTSDFLGSGARKMFLLPKYEVDPTLKFPSSHHHHNQKGQTQTQNQQIPMILDQNDRASIAEIEKWQARSSVGHWGLMRRVIRHEVWENW